jgi:DNA-binding protein HU-beta
MNKSDLIENVAARAGLTKGEAAKAVESVVESITEALKEGQTVSLIGFGTFTVRERAARTGRNPSTGELIDIAASRAPAFKAGKSLKDALN